jgi:hypothetical protein
MPSTKLQVGDVFRWPTSRVQRIVRKVEGDKVTYLDREGGNGGVIHGTEQVVLIREGDTGCGPD